MLMDELYRVTDPDILEGFKPVVSRLISRIVEKSRGDAQEVARHYMARINETPWPSERPASGKATVVAYRPALRHVRKVFVSIMEETATNPAFRPEPGITWHPEEPKIMHDFLVKVREHFRSLGESPPLPQLRQKTRAH